MSCGTARSICSWDREEGRPACGSAGHFSKSISSWPSAPAIREAEDHLVSTNFVRCITSSSPLKAAAFPVRSEEHTSELQSLMRISYAVFCLKKKKKYANKER